MKILLCNDDGYQAKGLSVLAKVASQYGQVRVIAPDCDKTAASHSLTLHRPLKIKQGENGFYYVNGTPSDSLHLALSLFEDFQPDWIFSGINHGVNMGDDILFSGTVACATQGYLWGISSVAFSLNDKKNQYWDTAEWVAHHIIETLMKKPAHEKWLLSINIPRVLPHQLQGVACVPLGKRHYDKNNVIATQDPYGETIYWIGPAGPPQLSEQKTDFTMEQAGYVTVTPLLTDRTDKVALPTFYKLFDQISL